MEIKTGWFYRTRDGGKAEVIDTQYQDFNYPVRVKYWQPEAADNQFTYHVATRDGRHLYKQGDTHALDLTHVIFNPEAWTLQRFQDYRTRNGMRVTICGNYPTESDGDSVHGILYGVSGPILRQWDRYTHKIDNGRPDAPGDIVGLWLGTPVAPKPEPHNCAWLIKLKGSKYHPDGSYMRYFPVSFKPEAKDASRYTRVHSMDIPEIK